MVMMLLNLLHVIHGLKTDKQVHVYTDPGENVTLNCSFTTGDLQWTFHESCSNKSVTISDNRKINKLHRIRDNYELADDETYNLKIKNMSECMEGKYVCCAINGTVPKCMSYFDLQLKVPPSKVRVLNMNDDNSVIGIENKILILACYASGGIPIGKTIWYHGEKKLTMNEVHSKWANYSFTPNSKHNDKIFTCQAEHDMLRTPLNKSITLNILYHPRVQCLWPKGPVSVGQNVNLSCSYYSNPLDAEISWTKNGQTVDYSHSIVTNIVIKSEKNLTEIDIITEDTQRVTYIMFENVTKIDEGEYMCNVTNTEGSASETVYLVVQDNDSETVPHSSPAYSGTDVKGFSMKEQMLYGVIVVLVVLVLIIMSLVGHAYIRIRCKQTNYAVPNTDVVRQTSFEIEMRDITSTEHDENDTLRNQTLLTNQEVTLNDDRHSDSSTTHSRSSSLHSNRSQNMNEDDYLHPYHSLVHKSMDVHAYAIVDRYENVEYEEIADVSKIRDYENLLL